MELQDYVRVSTMLEPFSELKHVDPEVVAKAGRRGTKVHLICEGIMSGLGEFDVSDHVSPYIESFKKWWELGHKVVSLEKRFFDPFFKITGQVDIILDTPEGLCIVDLKTSCREYRSWRIQGNAYCYLARENGFDIKKIMFLHLSRKGKQPKIIYYQVDMQLLHSFIQTYNYFYRNAQYE